MQISQLRIPNRNNHLNSKDFEQRWKSYLAGYCNSSIVFVLLIYIYRINRNGDKWIGEKNIFEIDLSRTF